LLVFFVTMGGWEGGEDAGGAISITKTLGPAVFHLVFKF
jgi:hypothetical protein